MSVAPYTHHTRSTIRTVLKKLKKPFLLELKYEEEFIRLRREYEKDLELGGDAAIIFEFRIHVLQAYCKAAQTLIYLNQKYERLMKQTRSV